MGKDIRTPYTPQPKQVLFHQCPANEILYGGAAGGGKSKGIRWDAFDWATRIPNLQIYIFRRTFPELERSHILESLKEYPQEAGRYKEGKHRWEFVNGSMIHFCHVERDKDVIKYQSEEIHILYIDELTHFTEAMYTYLRHRVRMSEELKAKLPDFARDQIPGIKAGTNPGGIGHSWVKKYWVDRCKPFMELDQADHVVQMGKTDGGMRRAFIPAKLDDNMYLDEDYKDRLTGLGGVLAKAMRDGNWDIFAGQAFPEISKEVHAVTPFIIPAHWDQFCVMDWGYNTPFSIGWYAHNDGVIYRTHEWYGKEDPDAVDQGMRLNVGEVADGLREREADYGLKPRRRIAGHDLWFERGMGSTQDRTGPSLAEEFSRRGFSWRRADITRRMGKQQLHMRLAWAKDDQGMAFDVPPKLVVFNTCHWFWRLFPSIVLDPANPEDIAPKQEDHVYDEVRYACMSRPMRAVAKPKDAPRLSMNHIDKTMKAAKRRSKRTGRSIVASYRDLFHR